jgi:hypothetical protein
MDPIFVLCPHPNLDESHKDNIVMACDGGLRANADGFGVVLSIQGNIKATTKMTLSSEFTPFSSYCSEAFGMLGAVLLFDKLQEYTKRVRGSRLQKTLKIVCDNEALVKTINRNRIRKNSPKFFYTSDADVVAEILAQIKHIGKQGETVDIAHVKGHQDRDRNKVLNLEARLNVEADRLATESLTLPNTHPVEMPTTNAVLLINDQVVSSNHTKILRQRYQLIALRKHYDVKNQWEPTTFDKVGGLLMVKFYNN